MAKRSSSLELTGPEETEPAYEVGYGKPPVHTRFKPGQSGNPRGRPRGAKNRRSRIPALNEERMKEVVIEEAYRTIGIRDGDRLVEIPMIKAVLRSVALNAAKGNQRAQRMFTELLRWVEGENKALHDRWFGTAVDYKNHWANELERRKTLGIDGPEPIPHPDDLVINMNTGSVEIRGPMTKEEKDLWDAAHAEKVETEALIEQLEAAIEAEPDDAELPDLLARHRGINARQVEVIGPYAVRLDAAERAREGASKREAKPAPVPSSAGSSTRIVLFDGGKK